MCEQALTTNIDYTLNKFSKNKTGLKQPVPTARKPQTNDFYHRICAGQNCFLTLSTQKSNIITVIVSNMY